MLLGQTQRAIASSPPQSGCTLACIEYLQVSEKALEAKPFLDLVDFRPFVPFGHFGTHRSMSLFSELLGIAWSSAVYAPDKTKVFVHVASCQSNPTQRTGRTL